MWVEEACDEVIVLWRLISWCCSSSVVGGCLVRDLVRRLVQESGCQATTIWTGVVMVLGIGWEGLSQKTFYSSLHFQSTSVWIFYSSINGHWCCLWWLPRQGPPALLWFLLRGLSHVSLVAYPPGSSTPGSLSACPQAFACHHLLKRRPTPTSWDKAQLFWPCFVFHPIITDSLRTCTELSFYTELLSNYTELTPNHAFYYDFADRSGIWSENTLGIMYNQLWDSTVPPHLTAPSLASGLKCYLTPLSPLQGSEQAALEPKPDHHAARRGRGTPQAVPWPTWLDTGMASAFRGNQARPGRLAPSRPPPVCFGSTAVWETTAWALTTAQHSFLLQPLLSVHWRQSLLVSLAIFSCQISIHCKRQRSNSNDIKQTKAPSTRSRNTVK